VPKHGVSDVQAEVRLAELAEERQGVQRAREATIRGEVLGCDRADRHYWWFPGASRESRCCTCSCRSAWAVVLPSY
jgi:hypothetical protein